MVYASAHMKTPGFECGEVCDVLRACKVACRGGEKDNGDVGAGDDGGVEDGNDRFFTRLGLGELADERMYVGWDWDCGEMLFDGIVCARAEYVDVHRGEKTADGGVLVAGEKTKVGQFVDGGENRIGEFDVSIHRFAKALK